MKYVYSLLIATLLVGSLSFVIPQGRSTHLSITAITRVYAQDAVPTPAPSATPEASKLPDSIKSAGDGLAQVNDFLGSKESIVLMVLGILFALSKRFSNEKANAVMKLVQGMFDALSYAVIKLGALLKYISDLLAKLIASDGIGGKQ